jgi:hypothetical protein
MRDIYAFIVKLGWHRVPWGRTRRPGGGGAGQRRKENETKQERIHQTEEDQPSIGS